MLADALDPEKKGVGAAHSSCLGDYLAVSLGKLLPLASRGNPGNIEAYRACRAYRVYRLCGIYMVYVDVGFGI